MSGQWVDYFRIVKPKQAKAAYLTADIVGAYDKNIQYSNYSWFASMMYGDAQRHTRYQRYRAMLQDVDIARGIDAIAEEMSGINEKTGLPFIVDYHNDDNKEVEESVVMTVKAGLRNWSGIHDLENKIFRIAKEMVAFGDCFFRKTSDHKAWAYVDPRDIIGIEVDEQLVPVRYHIKRLMLENQTFTKGEVEIVPADGMVHFSMCDDMGDIAPFGDSVLIPVERAFRLKQLLEDATVIYRIVRAPERRVFYVDTGGMNPMKVKKYLEEVKMDINQKRIASNLGGQSDMVDAMYNPTGMIEDYIFAVGSNGRGSRVETLPGGQSLGENAELQYFRELVLFGLRIPSSYFKNGQSGGYQYNDGKIGVAYMEELKFANFVKRLQAKLERVFDYEFKHYMAVSGIKVDYSAFKLRLPDPQNFALYKQAALDTELMNTFNAAENIKYLSKRFILKRYLGFTEDDIQTNEAMLRQERGIEDPENAEDMFDIRMFYDPAYYDNAQSITKDDIMNKTDGGKKSEDNLDSLVEPESEPDESAPEASVEPTTTTSPGNLPPPPDELKI